ncbi:hypothetical protein L1987_48507 [Smallanthus sonchifolius]|uniref:Uncharacterized protein n=1 Tax=Smallanthus sonchifolius TaxID=185202 RepID=A0ACB9FTS4_9ASTR|nr:hypothetical protein L1987_48507 [Smallanthus sonchifolius]
MHGSQIGQLVVPFLGGKKISFIKGTGWSWVGLILVHNPSQKEPTKSAPSGLNLSNCRKLDGHDFGAQPIAAHKAQPVFTDSIHRIHQGTEKFSTSAPHEAEYHCNFIEVVDENDSRGLSNSNNSYTDMYTKSSRSSKSAFFMQLEKFLMIRRAVGERKFTLDAILDSKSSQVSQIESPVSFFL